MEAKYLEAGHDMVTLWSLRGHVVSVVNQQKVVNGILYCAAKQQNHLM